MLGNLGLLAWMFLAAFGVMFYHYIAGWLYLLLLAFIIYAVLRRLGCSSCYRCKTCTSGFGRLAGAFFGTGFVKKESVGNRIGLVGLVYVLLVPVPLALVALSLPFGFSYLKVFVLVCILALAAFSFSTWFSRTAKEKS